MASINDWATKAAQRVLGEFPTYKSRHLTTSKSERYPSSDRIAAIIATFAEPLVKLLRESKREHYHCDDSWYCCGKCPHDCRNDVEDHEHDNDDNCYPASHGGEAARTSGVCNCGADEWNAKVDAALNG